VNLLVVILSSCGTLLGCVLAANQILRGMRKKWQQDAEQTTAVRDNTRAVQEPDGAAGEAGRQGQ
jgi:hypothetical protein